jgi:hypothetical protein
VFGIFPPVTDVAPPPRRQSSFNATWYLLFALAGAFIMATAMVAGALRATFRDRMGMLAAATVIGLLAAPPILHLYDYLEYGYFEPIVPRFGLSALAAIAVLIAAIATTAVARITVMVVALGLYTTALLTLT